MQATNAAGDTRGRTGPNWAAVPLDALPCLTMNGLDLSRLAPADAAATLRSFDRRFRAAVRPVDDPEVDEWAQIPGPDGHSAVDHAAAAGRTLIMLHNALRQVLTRDDPYLDEAVLDPTALEWPATTGPVDVELDALGHEASAMADLVDATPGPDWGRAGRAPGPTTVDAMQLVREAVGSGVTYLRGAEEAMAAARPD